MKPEPMTKKEIKVLRMFCKAMLITFEKTYRHEDAIRLLKRVENVLKNGEEHEEELYLMLYHYFDRLENPDQFVHPIFRQ
jgi:hypothetical protein